MVITKESVYKGNSKIIGDLALHCSRRHAGSASSRVVGETSFEGKPSEVMNSASMVMGKFAAHYLIHSMSSAQGNATQESLDMLRSSAELWLLMDKTYAPVISDVAKYKNDRRTALAVLAT